VTTFQHGASSDTGRVRTANQDALLAEDGRFVVADGMGGHLGGEIASQLTVDSMAEAAKPTSLDDVVVMVRGANDCVIDYATKHPDVRGMGTTVCLLMALSTDGPDRLAVANVGDSRLYLRDRRGLQRLTRDHSLVEALVREGRISADEAAVHPQRNILTQALGIDRRVQLDVWELVPRNGDRFLICSDGLHGELTDATIDEILSTNPSPQAAADALVLAACEAGGRDNVTVVVVDVADSPDDTVLSDDTVLPDDTVAPDDPVVNARLGVVTRSVPRPMAAPPRPEPVASVDSGNDTSPDGSLRGPGVVTWRVAAFAVAVVLVLSGLLVAVAMIGRGGYSVVVDDTGTVVVLQGPPDGFLWFNPTIEVMSDIDITELLPADRQNVRSGPDFGSLDEARVYLEYLTTRLISETDN
jgi:serine/threonine protein phosphatase PrpC